MFYALLSRGKVFKFQVFFLPPLWSLNPCISTNFYWAPPWCQPPHSVMETQKLKNGPCPQGTGGEISRATWKGTCVQHSTRQTRQHMVPSISTLFQNASQISPGFPNPYTLFPTPNSLCWFLHPYWWSPLSLCTRPSTTGGTTEEELNKSLNSKPWHIISDPFSEPSLPSSLSRPRKHTTHSQDTDLPLSLTWDFLTTDVLVVTVFLCYHRHNQKL